MIEEYIKESQKAIEKLIAEAQTDVAQKTKELIEARTKLDAYYTARDQWAENR